MHLLSTRAGGFVEDDSIITRLDQTPASIVILSSADTTLALLAQACASLAEQHSDFPSVRLANLLHLRQNASLDLYVDEVLQHANVVIVDHLGSESAWPYGIQQISALAKVRGQQLAMFSGDLQQDPHLLARSTLPVEVSQQLWQYLRAGGARNARSFLQATAWFGLQYGARPEPPRALPQVAIHVPAAWSAASVQPSSSIASVADLQAHWLPDAPVAAIVFYRAHLLAGNTGVFDALALALQQQGINALPLAIDSLKDALCLATLRQLCRTHDVQVVLNTTAFAALNADSTHDTERLAGDAPVIQAIVSGGNREDWQADPQGLRPRDIAMQVVLPELDGRIITRAISFKGLLRRCEWTQTDVVGYLPEPDRVAFVAELAARWCRLRQIPATQKKLALILANYPGSEGRIGSGIGLDTPASILQIVQRLKQEGYALGPEENMPLDGEQLMHWLQQGIANDPAQWPLRPAWQSYPLSDYQVRLNQLAPNMQQALHARWGPPEQDPMLRQGRFMIAGLRLGHVFIGIQPSRTHANVHAPQDYASYHDAEQVPPHHYLAFYFWLRDVFAIDAMVHVGTHGNLEWLPGKSLALSAQCWPDAILGPLPHLYPFIVNDPGEGAQAKRRSQAVIISHLMPPITRAEQHGAMLELEALVDEYYDALLVDARRAALLRQHILQAVREQQLAEELDLQESLAQGENDAVLERIDAYLCELKETQIRDGLHVFGQSPSNEQRTQTLLALAHFPVQSAHNRSSSAQQAEPPAPTLSLLQALAHDLLTPTDGPALTDPWQADAAHAWSGPRPAVLQALSDAPWRHCGDTRERLEHGAANILAGTWPHPLGPHTQVALRAIEHHIAPALDACGPLELQHLSAGLQGQFIPPSPSGVPSRGRADVLPTGRNFYTIDTRAIPTSTAWTLGQQAARRVLELHLQEHGEYPKTLGLSVWGTATMRTGGDDIAQAFALIGVRPKWAPGSQRVADFEVIPQVGLNRPRVDVTLRISGFFRDAFPGVVQMFDAAVQAVAAVEGEDETQNPIRACILRETAQLQAQGIEASQAREQAGWRIFGSPPGQYGTGISELMQSGQWHSQVDLAKRFVQWSAFAYGQHAEGTPANSALQQRLHDMQIVLHNHDHGEADVLDAADYYEFQGGMATAVAQHSGQQPALYHGDHRNPQQAKVRSLKEEIGRVVRARITNPKWIAGAQRHGYKGAFEMAATVDYLFGFAATTGQVSDHHWSLVTQAYVHDAHNRAFMQQHNPAALHDVLERLVDAMQRGLWQQPGDDADAIAQHLLTLENSMQA
ncbi:cobaltochelatase subunit CobN [Lampropedia puyangensis]|uniref:Cobaltochelatase subunit CobN n=1 Tax=Lampropedia puyangensis TaxID=1330072 RepID=A0A4V4GSE7_9BURK|nr:cobaltochelatase subunit CobN [Lampropedia puyangensis]THU05356.1 cobaltochelatase subunit CobN [Lampropedia puyangensis]